MRRGNGRGGQGRGGVGGYRSGDEPPIQPLPPSLPPSLPSSAPPQTREVEVYDPSSYISIMKNQPVEWFDNTMSYGVFNWGLSSTGVSPPSLPPSLPPSHPSVVCTCVCEWIYANYWISYALSEAPFLFVLPSLPPSLALSPSLLSLHRPSP